MNQLVQLLSDLVAINSINPDLVPGAPGEAELAAYVARWLERAGLEVQMEEPIAGRPNVIAIARGSGGGKTLLLNGHLDTVGVSGMAQPHQPVIRNGRLYGRGGYDMKAGLAACMLTVAAAKEHTLRGDVIFTAVIDEEYAGLGTLDIAQRYRADAAIVAEPTELQLIVAHKGFVWLEIETRGVAAHGSRPDLGVDAIAKMGRVLTEIEQLDHTLRAQPTHPLLRSGSLHASLIRGGQELSSYPAHCVLAVERRTVPGETPELVEKQLQAIIERIGREDPTFQAEVRRGLHRSPMEAPITSGIVPLLSAAATRILGHPPTLAGAPYWTDAASLDEVGIPSVLFGPIGAGAHAVEEWVDLASVQTCADLYLAAALEFCR